MQADSLHLALWAADNDMTTNDPFAARYDETALVAERQTALDALATAICRMILSIYLRPKAHFCKPLSR